LEEYICRRKVGWALPFCVVFTYDVDSIPPATCLCLLYMVTQCSLYVFWKVGRVCCPTLEKLIPILMEGGSLGISSMEMNSDSFCLFIVSPVAPDVLDLTCSGNAWMSQ
jgi:hypothetical protein